MTAKKLNNPRPGKSHSEEKIPLDVAVTGALDAIIIIDSDGKIIEFNPAAENIFGHSRESVIGRNMGDLIIPEKYRRAHKEGMRRYNETGFGPALNKQLELTCPFRKFHPARIRIVRQNHRILESDICDPARARNVRRRPLQVAQPA